MNWHQHNNPNAGGNEAAFDPYGAGMTAADLGVDAKMDFLRDVYKWLMFALAFGALVATGSFYLFTNNVGVLFSVLSPFVWIGILLGSMIITGMVVSRAMINPQTAGAGLFIYAAIKGAIFGPLLAVAYMAAAGPELTISESGALHGGSFQIIWQALILTGIVFSGLTAYVFLTKQDFSFMRGALIVCGMVFMGVIFVYLLGLGFGWVEGGNFWMGMGIAVFGILLAAGFILYDTSQILHKFTGAPGEAKMGALMLLSDLALLLWYVILFLIQLSASD